VGRGRFIVLEGGEGVGKTTQINTLTKQLQAAGRTVEFVREPGGEPLAEKIRDLVLSPEYQPEPETEVLLFNAARVQTLAKVSQLLEEGSDVVSDRSHISSIVYQGHGHRMNLQKVRAICDFAIQKAKPDLILVLSAPAKVVNERRDTRGVTDRFEQMDEAFHERVRQGYLAEAERLGLPVIDASPTIEEITEQIWNQVKPLLEEA
jgi:dTMP kinase